jgi:hypothetical protein
LIWNIEGRTYTDGIREVGAEENIWNKEGGWRKLHNEELHSLYSLPSIIRMTTKDEIARACSMYGRKNRDIYTGFWWQSQKEGDHKGDIDVGGRIILECISARYDSVAWNGLI